MINFFENVGTFLWENSQEIAGSVLLTFLGYLWLRPRTVETNIDNDDTEVDDPGHERDR